MNSNLENFTDLLIEISNEVLINRPCLVSRFISRMLESYLDRRTLWQMQMEAVEMAGKQYTKVTSTPQNSSSPTETGVSVGKKPIRINQSSLNSKFVARDSYLAHLAQKGSTLVGMNSKANNSNMVVGGEDCIEGSNSTPHASASILANARFNRPPAHKQCSVHKEVNIRKIKSKLRMDNAELDKEEVVYEQVLNSINVLIDIEKERKHSLKDLQVFSLLKGGSDKQDSAHASGIEESACLKPSVFRRFDSKPGMKNAEWNTKLKKLKAYNDSHPERGYSANVAKSSAVSEKIANYTELERNAIASVVVVGKKEKKERTETSQDEVQVTQETTETEQNDPSQGAKSHPNTPPLSPISRATLSSPFILKNTPTLPQDSPPLEERSSRTNISSEFEFNRRLINSSVECLLDPSKVKVDVIASENDRLLKQLAPSSSSSSLSSMEYLLKGMVGESDGWKSGSKVEKGTNVLKESPEALNLLPSSTDKKVPRWLAARRKARRVGNRACSDSKLKKDDWREYQARGTPLCESAQDMVVVVEKRVVEKVEDEERLQDDDELVQGAEEVMVRATSESHLHSLLLSNPQSNQPPFQSSLFPPEADCQKTQASPLNILGAKWLDGLESSLSREGGESKTWSSEYYRTTWIVNSNTSLGLDDTSLHTSGVLEGRSGGRKKPHDTEFTPALSESRRSWWVEERPMKVEKNNSNLLEICCEGPLDKLDPSKQLCDLLTSLPPSDHPPHHDTQTGQRLHDDVHCEGKQGGVKRYKSKGSGKVVVLDGNEDEITEELLETEV